MADGWFSVTSHQMQRTCVISDWSTSFSAFFGFKLTKLFQGH